MLVEFGKANLIDKARQQPDKVRMVIDKVRTDRVVPTLAAVRSKLDQPLAMGYCNVGIVNEIGDDVSGFTVGERVASNGKHAAVVSVPVNLCARVPENVSDEEAAFTVIGAVALQGIRLVQPTLGEVVVTGLGLIGLITVQLLRAQGCRVLGIDREPSRIALARQFGAETVDLSQSEDAGDSSSLFPGAGCGRGHHYGVHQKQRSGASGGVDVPQTGPHHAGRSRGARAFSSRFLREGVELSGVLFLWAGSV